MLDSSEIVAHPSFNKAFLAALAWRLGETFARAADRGLQGIWCDGILDPLVDEASISQAIYHRRKLVVTAFMGYDGQDRYAMTIWFGPKAQRRVARSLPLEECIPPADSMDWITWNPDRRAIEIRMP